MTIAETTSGRPSAARLAAPAVRDVAVHPFHRIRRRERQTPGQHFVERHTERVESLRESIERFIRPVCSGAM